MNKSLVKGPHFRHLSSIKMVPKPLGGADVSWCTDSVSPVSGAAGCSNAHLLTLPLVSASHCRAEQSLLWDTDSQGVTGVRKLKSIRLRLSLFWRWVLGCGGSALTTVSGQANADLKTPNHSTYKRNCGKCIKQQIYGENTKQTLLAQKSSQNKAQQAETYVSSQRVSVAYKCSISFWRPWQWP